MNEMKQSLLHQQHEKKTYEFEKKKQIVLNDIENQLEFVVTMEIIESLFNQIITLC